MILSGQKSKKWGKKQYPRSVKYMSPHEKRFPISAMKPVTPQTEGTPATQFRKSVFGSSHFSIKPLHFSFLLTILCLSAQGFAETRPSPPNIVIIFTDDQRADAVGYVGNTAIHTPNLDRLAKEGLVFKNCFVNTSICAVNRANLLSGQYPHRHGIDDFFKTFSAAQFSRSVPARLRAAGYQTAFFGKWGIGDTAEKTALGAGVFDYWAGQPKQSISSTMPTAATFTPMASSVPSITSATARRIPAARLASRSGPAKPTSPIRSTWTR